MKTKLNLWLSRDLTLYGRSLLAKAIGVSQLVYVASMLSVPNSATIKSVQAQLFSSLWRNRKDKSTPRGAGLNIVNFATMVKSLRLAWISRLLSESNDSWQSHFKLFGIFRVRWFAFPSQMRL